jgi:long-chain acyl-CoA synthetase
VLQIAGGLQRLGVREGDCVCILMRNDIAFLEASYAVMTLGGYAVPVNWHFKPEEISYITKDTATRVLIGHTDLLNLVRDVVPHDITVLSVPTPPEIIANYRIDPAHLDTPRRASDLETWLADQKPYSGPKLPPLHIRHHRTSEGRP